MDYRIQNLKLAKALGRSLAHHDIKVGWTGQLNNDNPMDGLEAPYLWVRFEENGEAVRVINMRVSSRMPNVRVNVGRNSQTGLLEVLGLASEAASDLGDIAPTLNIPDRIADLINEPLDLNRVKFLRAMPGTNAFDVDIAPGFYWYLGEFRAWSGGTINIASSVPAGFNTKRPVLIGIDPATESLVSYDGDVIFMTVPPLRGKMVSEEVIAQTVEDAAMPDVIWIACIPLTVNDGSWSDYFRTTALQFVPGNGSTVSSGKVRVSSADTTPDYLYSKMAAGNGITLAIANPAANEDVSITVNQSQLSLANLGTRNFTNLADVPSSYSGQAGKAVRVNAGATGLEFYTPSSSLAGLSDVTITSVADKDQLYYDAGAGKWVNGKITVAKTGDAMTGTLTITSTEPSLLATTIYVPSSGDASVHGSLLAAISINQNGQNLTNDTAGVGVRGITTISGTSGTVTGAAGMVGQVIKTNGGTLTNAYAVYAAGNTKSAGTVTNNYGVYVASQSIVGAANYGIYTNAGLNQLGDQLSIVGSADRVQSVIKANGTQTNDLQQWQASGGGVLAAIGKNGALSISQAATTGTPSASVTVTSAAHTALTASTEFTEINLNLSATQQFATGALTTQRAIRVQAPTYSAVGSSTITTAVTVDISGSPIPGTNVTITNSIALRAGGRTQINGTVDIVPPASTGTPKKQYSFNCACPYRTDRRHRIY